ncbi:hypothetical protein [Rickettsiella endosymbiont of Dermanyssus gallinae]|uniref:hypothetical protein n=1 Tax=Rickettsiella endosymbiont of Dermanyssus gallinae TaxID=2856608 RepID=UPI001C528F68|nr:hypothetical protein [Rickettsiella endosymbiont of Dermanyssus gallinae]
MSTPTGMPYYFAENNAHSIVKSIYFAVGELKGSAFDASSSLLNFKNHITQTVSSEILGLEDKAFFKQDLNSDPAFTAYLASVKQLTDLNHRTLLNDPYAAIPLINEAKEKYQAFVEQQKMKFNIDFKDSIPEKQRTKLWENYEKGLSSAVKPVEDFSDRVSPSGLLTQAMRFYVNKIMNNKEKNKDFSKIPTSLEDTLFTPRPQFLGSDDKPITVEYDQEGRAKSIRVHPYTGNVGDALAIFLASRKPGEEIPPIKIVCPLSNADILKSEMSPGFTLLALLLVHTMVNRWQQNAQRKQVLNAAIEKGIPLKHISLEDKRGRPIPIIEPKSIAKMVFNVKSDQEQLDEARKNNLEGHLKDLPEIIPAAGMAAPSMTA